MIQEAIHLEMFPKLLQLLPVQNFKKMTTF
jgi:hypothetical protein